MSENCTKCVVNPRAHPDLLCDSCHKEAEKLNKARKAIQHVLTRIRDDSAIGWYMGYGTGAFQYLTEAAAALWDEPPEKVEEMFMPAKAANPQKELRDACLAYVELFESGNLRQTDECRQIFEKCTSALE